jgi:hypothetical protein
LREGEKAQRSTLKAQRDLGAGKPCGEKKGSAKLNGAKR